MRRARSGALLLLLGTIAVATTLAMSAVRRSDRVFPDRPPGQRPHLLLLTSLPLVFAEGFSLVGSGSPVEKRLAGRYRLIPISVTDQAELAKGRLLLMAQPQAQNPENLVALDAWVRRGGRLLLLADPLLEWQSALPPGDVTRAPPMFMDTGLLAHWGLRLDAPEQRGAARRRLDGYDVLTLSPGALYGQCRISSDRLVAHCRIGKGAATIVADADLLNVARLGSGAGHNLDAIVAELASLEQT